jgi:maltooligosyltrehalose trehalohydrolase
MSDSGQHRRLPIGAEPDPSGGVHFRIWAPRRRSVDVVLEANSATDSSVRLRSEGNGYFSGTADAACPGTRYGFRLDDEGKTYPDPASRFQPEGPHGPSEVVDPGTFLWTDADWRGVDLEGQVIYEMHVGTFTEEGTWRGASEHLRELADTGITVVEVMPVADFDGTFGWGYDGVDMFAPTRLYGSPDDFRRFVDTAHSLGLAVILDVVYNHFGPSGNYLGMFSDAYITHEKENEWGDAINFDGPDSGPVREFFVSNAAYWIDEYHLDGLRLDATQQIFDDSEDHILAAIERSARAVARGRRIILVAENEAQHTHLARPASEGGYGLDGLWNDDFHHTVRVALTGKREAYYSDYFGTPAELAAAAKYGYLFQGQHYMWQKQPRGTSARGLLPHVFVNYLENHDQVANSATGARLHQLSSPGRHRAMTAFLLLGPWTPMLFQGQEFNASTPFLFFADHDPELAEAVKRGRAEFMSQFPSLTSSGGALSPTRSR